MIKKSALTLLLLFSILSPALGVSSGTFTIGTGQDYPTIFAFEAILAPVLLGSVTGYINVNYNDTTAVIFAGTVTNTTSTVSIICNEAYRSTGTFDTSKFWLKAPNYTSAITIQYDNVLIDGLQIENASTANTGTNMSACVKYEFNGATNITVKNCPLRAAKTESIGLAFMVGEGTAYNNTLYGFIHANGAGVYIRYVANPENIELDHNTIIKCGTAVKLSAGNGGMVMKNTLFAENTVDATGTYGAGTDYNASTGTIGYTVTGSGNTHDKENQTFTFINTNLYDYGLSVTDIGAIDSGETLDLVQVDARGTARPTGSASDIGSVEYPYMAGYWGATTSELGMNSNEVGVTSITFTQGGTITSLSAQMRSAYSTTDAIYKLALYYGGATPGAWIVTTSSNGFAPAGTTWEKFEMDPTYVAAGDYYIAALSPNSAGVVYWQRITTSGLWHYKTSVTYPNFDDPFGTPTQTLNRQFSAYATYYPSDAPAPAAPPLYLPIQLLYNKFYIEGETQWSKKSRLDLL